MGCAEVEVGGNFEQGGQKMLELNLHLTVTKWKQGGGSGRGTGRPVSSSRFCPTAHAQLGSPTCP